MPFSRCDAPKTALADRPGATLLGIDLEAGKVGAASAKQLGAFAADLLFVPDPTGGHFVNQLDFFQSLDGGQTWSSTITADGPSTNTVFQLPHTAIDETGLVNLVYGTFNETTQTTGESFFQQLQPMAQSFDVPKDLLTTNLQNDIADGCVFWVGHSIEFSDSILTSEAGSKFLGDSGSSDPIVRVDPAGTNSVTVYLQRPDPNDPTCVLVDGINVDFDPITCQITAVHSEYSIERHCGGQDQNLVSDHLHPYVLLDVTAPSTHLELVHDLLGAHKTMGNPAQSATAPSASFINNQGMPELDFPGFQGTPSIFQRSDGSFAIVALDTATDGSGNPAPNLHLLQGFFDQAGPFSDKVIIPAVVGGGSITSVQNFKCAGGDDFLSCFLLSATVTSLNQTPIYQTLRCTQ